MRLLLAAHLERAFHQREDLPHAFMDPAMPQRPAGETTGAPAGRRKDLEAIAELEAIREERESQG